MCEVARAHVAEFGTGRHGLLICTPDGLPEARFHGTRPRHTFASMLLSGGVSVAAAADYLGHSPAVLLKTYAHLLPADHDRACSVVQAACVTSVSRRTWPNGR